MEHFEDKTLEYFFEDSSLLNDVKSALKFKNVIVKNQLLKCSLSITSKNF